MRASVHARLTALLLPCVRVRVSAVFGRVCERVKRVYERERATELLCIRRIDMHTCAREYVHAAPSVVSLKGPAGGDDVCTSLACFRPSPTLAPVLAMALCVGLS